MNNSQIIALSIGALIGIAASNTDCQAQFKLTVVEKMVQNAHPVPNISYERLSYLLLSRDSNNVVLIDVRSPEEYAVSHLKKSFNFSSDISSEEIVRKYSSTIRGKLVVVYCAVGYRSSMFIERLHTTFEAIGAAQTANLLGGIFRWYNEGGSVYDVQGTTDNIHRYNEHWGKLVKQRNSAN